MFQRITRQRVSDEVFHQIQSRIIKGELKPGSRLPSERDMAAEFGVSRVAIREALRRLEQLGLVTVKVGVEGGAIVEPLSHRPLSQVFDLMVGLEKETLTDLIEVRRIIEVPAAGLAAVRRSDDDLEMMEQAIRDMALAGEERVQAKFLEFNLAFHMVVVEAAKNKVLKLLMRSVEEVLQNAFDLVPFTLDIMRSTVRSHTEIYEAIKRKDKTAAESLTEQHVDDFRKYLLLKNSGNTRYPSL